jgi:hypothetical protein
MAKISYQRTYKIYKAFLNTIFLVAEICLHHFLKGHIFKNQKKVSPKYLMDFSHPLSAEKYTGSAYLHIHTYIYK